MVYDGDGNRVSETMGSTTTKYLVDDKNPTGYSQVMDEIVNGSVTRTYTYGRQLISEKQEPQACRRQRGVLKSFRLGVFLAIEEHQPAIQVVGQHQSRRSYRHAMNEFID